MEELGMTARRHERRAMHARDQHAASEGRRDSRPNRGRQAAHGNESPREQQEREREAALLSRDAGNKGQRRQDQARALHIL